MAENRRFLGHQAAQPAEKEGLSDQNPRKTAALRVYHPCAARHLTNRQARLINPHYHVTKLLRTEALRIYVRCG